MFEDIKQEMARVGHSDRWLQAQEPDALYMLETLMKWQENDIPVNPQHITQLAQLVEEAEYLN